MRNLFVLLVIFTAINIGLRPTYTVSASSKSYPIPTELENIYTPVVFYVSNNYIHMSNLDLGLFVTNEFCEQTLRGFIEDGNKQDMLDKLKIIGLYGFCYPVEMSCPSAEE